MILLDTHVVIWLMTFPNRISKPAAQAIAQTGDEGCRPAISAATIFEMMYAKRRGRVQVQVSDALLLRKLRDWFDVYPITESIAIEAAALSDTFHGDPMDRIITGTALVENCTLITSDERIRRASACRTLW